MATIETSRQPARRRKLNMRAIFKGDIGLWVLFLLLCAVSLVAVYSSIGLYAYSAFVSRTPTSLFLRHLLIVMVTTVIVIWFSHIDYRYFSRFAVWGYWGTLVLLVVMLALGRGRWLHIPIIGSLQPSEIAKVVLVLFVARMLAVKKEQLDDLGVFLQLLIYIIPVVILILPTNFSMAALIFSVCYLVMYLGGVNRTYWWRLMAAIVLAVGVGLAVAYIHYECSLYTVSNGGGAEQLLDRSTTWGHRIYSWFHPNPDELSQENMARMAIARGGIKGSGIGNTVHARLMTQAHNDFIYAIILEETGLWGGLGVFVLYAWFYIRCIKIARKCKGLFGALTVAGLGTMVYLQAVLNMCVAVGVIPVTGQTLPFISYGGSAFIFLGCGLGVIQAIAADNKKQQMAASLESAGQPQDQNVAAEPTTNQ